MDDQLRLRIHGFLLEGSGARASEISGQYAVASTLGLVRQQNQDAAVVVVVRFGGSPERDFDIAVVCDGLGGMKQGREAANLGLSAFVSRLLRTTRVPLPDRLRSAMLHANDEVHRLLRGGGGTTMSAVVTMRSGLGAIVHAGDSRVYEWRGDAELHQITPDDTLDAMLNRDPDALEGRDSRILQFVGMGEDLEPHVLPLPADSAKAYLLTTDGAHDLPSYLLRRAVGAARQPTDLPRRLVQISELLGGLDNATAAVLPARISQDATRPADGVDLTIISPSGKLNVWIPQITEERREAGADAREKIRHNLEVSNANPAGTRQADGRSEVAAGSTPLPSLPPLPIAPIPENVSARKPAKKPRKKGRKASDAPPNAQLPLPPASVNIRLGEDGE